MLSALAVACANTEFVATEKDCALSHTPDTSARMQEFQSEFDQLLCPYTENWGITKEDIDKELSDAHKKMSTLRKKDRHSKVLQHKISNAFPSFGRVARSYSS